MVPLFCLTRCYQRYVAWSGIFAYRRTRTISSLREGLGFPLFKENMVMANRSLLSRAIEHYVGEVITKETPLQRRLRAETAKLPMAGMQIGADQGAFLALRVQLIGARRALEIGTFPG